MTKSWQVFKNQNVGRGAKLKTNFGILAPNLPTNQKFLLAGIFAFSLKGQKQYQTIKTIKTSKTMKKLTYKTEYGELEIYYITERFGNYYVAVKKPIRYDMPMYIGEYWKLASKGFPDYEIIEYLISNKEYEKIENEMLKLGNLEE